MTHQAVADFRPDVTTDVATGLSHSPTGERCLSVPEAFFASLAESLDTARAGSVLRDAGKAWGAAFVDRFLRSSPEGDSLLDRPLAEFAGSLDAAFARQGWGRLTCDFTEAEQGAIRIIWDGGPEPVALREGVLVGVFSALSGETLDCEPLDSRTCTLRVVAE